MNEQQAQNVGNNGDGNKFSAFLRRKNVVISVKRYLIDALGAMALGLFASLLIGTIFDTLASKLSWQWPWLTAIAGYAKAVAGPAIAIAIGYGLQAPSLVLFSLCAVGLAANELGGPLGAFVAVVVACELGKLVSKETKVDILVTPAVTIISGCLVAIACGPAINSLMTALGGLIMKTTELHPFSMGVLVSVIVGVILTLPISSAAICVAIGLVGLAGGAATAGCCAQMVGFAVMSFKENGWGGLVAQGLGTSMLQMGNIVHNPRIWLPPTLAAAVTGPIATCVFGLESGIAVASGMGTCGLVGPIGLLAAESFGGAGDWLGLALVCVVLPALLTPLFAWPLRKCGWIKDGDLKLDL